MTNSALFPCLIAKVRTELDLPHVKLSAGYYYQSLPLAVIDAVFSIGVRYESVVNAVHCFAGRAGWRIYRPHGSPYPEVNEQRTMSEFLAEFTKLTPSEHPSTIFGNRSFANPASAKPIPKAELVRQVAAVLVSLGIERFVDFQSFPEPRALDEALCTLPAMSSGVIVSYIRMLCGSETDVKPDRHIHAFIRAASGNATLLLTNSEVSSLMKAAALALASEQGLNHLTPRMLDHAVWNLQRKSGTRKPSPTNSQPREQSFTKTVSLAPDPSFMGSQPALLISDFWRFCQLGGVTHQGLTYCIDNQDRLHIVSPRSANKNYRISRNSVATYLKKAHEAKFRQNHGWFSSVYNKALREIRLTP